VYGLTSPFERLRERGWLTGAEIAKKLGVSTTTIHTLGRAGLIRKQRYGNNIRCLYEFHDTNVYVKGKGGRRPKQPNFINAQQS